MNSQSDNDFPHLILHALTALIALAALVLALYNYREAKKMRSVPARAVSDTVMDAAGKEKEKAPAIQSGKKNASPLKRAPRAVKKKGKTKSAKPLASKEERGIPARPVPEDERNARGLHEIVTDLVDDFLGR